MGIGEVEEVDENDEKIKGKSTMGEIIDFFKDLIIIVIVVRIVTLFIVSVFIIKGQSMYASYYDKEFILVDRFSTLEIGEYKDQKVTRGDVLVFKPGVHSEREFYIKRLIGIAGDSIKIEKGEVYIKRKGEDKFIILKEEYLTKENKGHTKVGKSTKKHIFNVPDGKYFVMGDNRNNSSDSRSCFGRSCLPGARDNYVEKRAVVGKVLLDFGYFNYKNFSFTHPGSEVAPEIKGISTKPRWTNSPDTYNY